jgi:hypothetical protein
MTESFAHNLDRDPCSQADRGVGVPEIVEPNSAKPGRLHPTVEHRSDDIGVGDRAIGLAKDRLAVPVATGERLGLALLVSVK